MEIKYKKRQVKKWKVSAFYKLANINLQYIEEPDKIFAQEIDDIFWKELEIMIKENELINIQINGQVRGGKSTVAFKITKEIFKFLHKYNKTKEEFSLRNIAMTQDEMTKKAKNPEYNQTVIMTDEYDRLEESGENTTIEQSLRESLSDIHAGRYIHKIYCAPKYSIDRNTDIFIEVITKDKKEKKTLCHVSYQLYSNGIETRVPLGQITIDVSDIIKKWIEIEEIFYRYNEIKNNIDKYSKEEIMEINKYVEKIIKYSKEDLYTRYMMKKFNKMDLMIRHGIFQVRMLDYYLIVRDAIKYLFTLAKINRITELDISSTVEKFAKKYNIPLTELGKKNIRARILSVTNKIYRKERLREQVAKLNKRYEKTGNEDYLIRADELNDYIKRLAEDIYEDMEEINQNIKLKKILESNIEETIKPLPIPKRK